MENHVTSMTSDILDLYRVTVPILLAIIAFWLIRFVRKVDKLADIIISLQMTVKSQNTGCIEKHKSINAHLHNHDVDIKEIKETAEAHTTDIKLIKQQLNPQTS